MSLPLIGIVPQLDTKTPMHHVRLFPEYQRSLEKAGGIGVMLPLTNNLEILNQIANSFDGFLFTGGQDLNPVLYGEEKIENIDSIDTYSTERDSYECLFYPIVKKLNKPILAICRGFQLINVIHGGTIMQDLPRESDKPGFILHPAWNDKHQFFHDIIINPDSNFSKIMGQEKIIVNSYHHQGIKKLGNGLSIAGISPDGLVEAFEIDDLDFGLAVQWHPEVLFDYGIDDGKIFKAFLNSCRKK